jgi:hypothetical protein
MQYTNLLIILALTSCSSLIQETELAEKILHDVEVVEVEIEHDLEEPAGCNSQTQVENGQRNSKSQTRK